MIQYLHAGWVGVGRPNTGLAYYALRTCLWVDKATSTRIWRERLSRQILKLGKYVAP